MINYVLSIILSIYLISSSLSPLPEPDQNRNGASDDSSEIFFLLKDPYLQVSLDTGWERNGKIPVFVAISDLEVIQRVEANSIPFESNLENRISEMLGADTPLPFVIYEKNSLRTRMALMDFHDPITFKLNSKKKIVEIYVGEIGLKWNPFRVQLTDIANGELYQLTFSESDVYQSQSLIYWPSGGIIYAIPQDSIHSVLPFCSEETTKWAVWAVRNNSKTEYRLHLERERK